jgi:NAD(P)-dependent dehydrogenase (short-subunit alcohol dehydrogenase family)
MTVPAARDLSVIGVRVNTICPGIIDTPIYGFSGNAEEFKARLVAPVAVLLTLVSVPHVARLLAVVVESRSRWLAVRR